MSTITAENKIVIKRMLAFTDVTAKRSVTEDVVTSNANTKRF